VAHRGSTIPATPDSGMASVHVYDWGNVLAARSCVQLGLGLTVQATSDLLTGGLPISLLCDEPLAGAVAAYISEMGGKCSVTPEPGMGVRLLARLDWTPA